MNTINNPLVADCGIENSDINWIELENQIANENSLKDTVTYFRDKPIAYITEVNYKQEYAVNAFDATIDSFETPTNHNHFISHNGNVYKRDEFLYTFFSDYKKYKKRVNFTNDNIYYLNSNQRNKLQYHILAQKYKLLPISEQDKIDIELFCKKYKNEHEQAQQWYNRISREQGHEKIITFGVSLEVQGANKGVWCYTSDIDSASAIFQGVSMDWETWLKPIIKRLNTAHEEMRQKRITDSKQKALYYGAAYELIKPLLYYQKSNHLTLPQAETEDLRAWIYKYLDSGNAPLPLEYKGIMPLADLAFTIDFDRDIEIVDTKDIRDMAQYNKENNAQHNIDMGKRKVEKTFSRLVGNEWRTHEIMAQGFTKPQIARFARDKLIVKVGHGRYARGKGFQVE